MEKSGGTPGPLAFSDVLLEELTQLRDTPELGALREKLGLVPRVPPPERGLPCEERERQATAHRRAEAARRQEIYNYLHTATEPLKGAPPLLEAVRPMSALCLSGGGIRSASFSLGVLQGLAKAVQAPAPPASESPRAPEPSGVLKCFDYLSTVSGGGYLGGWLTAWMREARARGEASPLETLGEMTTGDAVDPEAPQIRFLRFYSNYLAPRLGLLSADTWTLAATFLRNMLLNWLVLIPLFITLLMIPRAFMGGLMSRPSDWMMSLCWIVAGMCLLWSTAYSVVDMPSGGGRGGRERSFLWHRLLPLILGSWLVVLGWAWVGHTLPPPPAPPTAAQGSTLAPVGAGVTATASATASGDGSVPVVATATAVATRPSGGDRRPAEAAAASSALVGKDHPSGLQWWHPPAFFFGPSLIGGLIGAFLARRRLDRAESKHEPRRLAGLFFSQLVAVTLSGIALWAVATWVFPYPARGGGVISYAAFATPAVLTIFLLGNFLFAGLAGRVTRDPDREWWGRSSGWILLSVVTLAVLGAIVFWAPVLIAWLQQAYPSPKVIFSAIGGVGGVAGILSALFGYSSETSAKDGAGSALRRFALPIGAILFLIILAVLLIVTFDWWLGPAYALPFTGPDGTWNPEAWRLVWCAAIPVLVSLIMSWLVNVNDFSLHAMYRNRLIRAFLGASRPERHAHAFTGFDPADNFELRALAPPCPAGLQKPLHIINTALNLVAAGNLAWQERKAEPFTISSLHCGSPDPELGYQPAATYADGLSIGTAVTISGAAANPNMGYHSSPLVALLMTLFNVRLGWWLPNPGTPGRGRWGDRGPRFSAVPLLYEAFGNTTNTRKWVNLSDGGHFENLGVYEMVLRRCRHIVAIDGGADEHYVFEDLGNAIRKVRIDLGISIEIKLRCITPKEAASGQLAHCAYGEINYSDVDGPGAGKGLLIYIKPLLTEEAPADILNYQSAHPEFPHETTGDQFFSESQFESYRMLGCHSVKQICASVPAETTPRSLPAQPTVADFCEHARAYVNARLEANCEEKPPAILERWMRSAVQSQVRADCREKD